MKSHNEEENKGKIITVKKVVLLAGVFFTAFLNAQTWQPPIGIPAPEFGIHETHRMYEGKFYDFGKGPELYKDAGYGPYTHYIDNAHPDATDINNPFGTPDVPRLSIPNVLLPGSVAELHGGPYRDPTNYKTYIGVSGSATMEKPIFVRGHSLENKIVMENSRMMLEGAYIIVENIIFKGPPMGIRLRAPSHHIGVRHTEVTDIDTGRDNVFALSPRGDGREEMNEHIVFYKNYHHNNGHWCDSTDNLHNDYQVSGNSKDIWILDSLIETGSEDGIQIIFHNDSKYIPENIFIGRNEFHHHTENAIDVKPSRNVVISENIFHGYTASQIGSGDGSDGSAVCFNREEGAPGQFIDNHFLISNTFYDCDIGVRAEYGALIYNNLFYNLREAAVFIRINDPENARYVVNNIMFDVGVGIQQQEDATFYAINNIIALKDTSLRHVQYNSQAREINNNIFWSQDGNARLWVGSNDRYNLYVGLNQFPVDSGFENCWEGVSEFLSDMPGSENFLKTKHDSLSVNNGISNGRVQEFLTKFGNVFGMNIAKDFNGTVRPQGVAWDIGAYEYVNSGPTLTVISPNGGENWRLGEQRDITWSANEVTGNVVIELLQNGNLVGTIATVPVGLNSYTWQVGQYQGGNVTSGSGYKIRVRTETGSVLSEMHMRRN